MNITVPPLRDRKGDIDLLVDYFMHKCAYELKRDVMVLPVGVMKHFEKYHWPGNIRELENIVQRIHRVIYFFYDELGNFCRCFKRSMSD